MKQLTPITVNAPGAYGLNKKLERLDIGAQWCVEATNAVIDESGVLASRKGWVPVNGTAITGSPDPRTIFEYVTSSGASRIITAAGNKLWEGTATLTDVTGTLTPTADNWKFVNFNNKVIGVQAGHKPIVKTNAGNFAEIVFSQTVPNNPYEVLSGWGKVWYVDADGKTIRWSDTLDETRLWQDPAITGTDNKASGLLNLATVWGGDEIVALAAFKDYLVIFGKEHIVLYDGPEDPNASLRLAEIIYGTGCLARDSVQNTGNDILFLGQEGLTSLARNVQDGALPLTNLSENVQSYLDIFIAGETKKFIKSSYQADVGVYLLSLPTSNQVFYFNFKYRTPEGLPRITNWTSIKPTALMAARDGTLYLGKPGYVAKQDKYLDNGASYELKVKLGWSTGGGQAEALYKIPKNALVTVKGGYSSTLTMDWGFDYKVPSDSSQQDIVTSSSPSEYGTAEYGTSEYSGLSAVTDLAFRMSGSGRAIQYGFRYVVDGSSILLQRADIFVKLGRVI